MSDTVDIYAAFIVTQTTPGPTATLSWARARCSEARGLFLTSEYRCGECDACRAEGIAKRLDPCMPCGHYCDCMAGWEERQAAHESPYPKAFVYFYSGIRFEVSAKGKTYPKRLIKGAFGKRAKERRTQVRARAYVSRAREYDFRRYQAKGRGCARSWYGMRAAFNSIPHFMQSGRPS